MVMTGFATPVSVSEAFANQVSYCHANGAPITAAVVGAVAAALDQPTAFAARIREWPGHPLADGLPLRAAGGLHALQLSGEVPALAPVYAGTSANAGAIVAAAIAQHDQRLLPWLDGPPQTNEAGRSSSYIAAMLWLARQGLPARCECLEIGSSAGINLMIDRYRFDLGGVGVGPVGAAMMLRPEWVGPPPPAGDIAFAGLHGCDVAPIDLTDPAQLLRLKAFVWPEHKVRFERLDQAAAAARVRKPDLVRADAADFVAARLALPQEPGTTRVLMHSIVWQYVGADSQARITREITAAAASATRDRALAWISLEANRSNFQHELNVRFWPGNGEPHLLARAHAHGAHVEWLASAAEPLSADRT